MNEMRRWAAHNVRTIALAQPVHILDTLGCFDAAPAVVLPCEVTRCKSRDRALQLAGTRSAAGAVDHPVNSPDGDVSPRNGATAGQQWRRQEEGNAG